MNLLLLLALGALGVALIVPILGIPILFALALVIVWSRREAKSAGDIDRQQSSGEV